MTYCRWQMGRILLIAALGLAGGALAGCSADYDKGVQYEKQGQFAKAYDYYFQTLDDNPINGRALAGLRRTMDAAVAYWRLEAGKAEAAGSKKQAALCYLKVLQIRPDDTDSEQALRRLYGEHPERALADAVIPSLIGEEEVAAAPVAVAEAPQLIVMPPRPQATQPGQFTAGAPPTRQPPQTRFTARPPPASAPTPEIASAGPIIAPAPPAVRQIAPPAATPPAAPRPPASRPAAAVADVPAADPNAQFLVLATASVYDKRFPGVAVLSDGLSFAVKGAQGNPLRADLEIYSKGTRLGDRLKRLTIGSEIVAPGYSGRQYELVVLGILARTQTVTVGVRDKTD